MLMNAQHNALPPAQGHSGFQQLVLKGNLRVGGAIGWKKRANLNTHTLSILFSKVARHLILFTLKGSRERNAHKAICSQLQRLA